MNIEEKERLAHTGNIGVEASAIRLLAARMASGVTQAEVAAACAIKKTAYSNMETGRSMPTRPVMKYFYRQHRIDFNFLIHGDFAQLPADIEAQVFAALETANSQWDRKRHSDRRRSGEAHTLPRTT